MVALGLQSRATAMVMGFLFLSIRYDEPVCPQAMDSLFRLFELCFYACSKIVQWNM